MDFFTSLEGFIFGFTHVAILLIGYYSGWSINRLLKITTNGYVVGIVGAVLAHVISDLIASEVYELISNYLIKILLIFIY